MRPPTAKRLQPLAQLPAGSLLIHEIYASIQGESSYVGLPCTFVRTTACNLRCTYCDTRHAFSEGAAMTVDNVLGRVHDLGQRLVEITGGEPLLQPAVQPLMTALVDRGHTVLLETSGSVDIHGVDPRVVKIVDLKTPGSGEDDQNLWSNLAALLPHDEVKLVLADRRDYEWAVAQIRRHDLPRLCSVLVGPVYGALDPKDLAAWVLADKLPVRMQIQMHKAVWGAEARGV